MPCRHLLNLWWYQLMFSLDFYVLCVFVVASFTSRGKIYVRDDNDRRNFSVLRVICRCRVELTRIRNQSSVENIITGKLSMLMKFLTAFSWSWLGDTSKRVELITIKLPKQQLRLCSVVSYFVMPSLVLVSRLTMLCCYQTAKFGPFHSIIKQNPDYFLLKQKQTKKCSINVMKTKTVRKSRCGNS